MWLPTYTEEARTLGAPLEAGEELYTDIQNTYNVYKRLSSEVFYVHL